jgi:hypothetical protein
MLGEGVADVSVVVVAVCASAGVESASSTT